MALVSVLYAANLAGRVLASRVARTWTAETVLFAALGSVLAGLPFLLLATGIAAAITGIALAGAGIGALFPLTSSLHVQASGRTADRALGETLAVAALGQITGPLVVAAVAQVADLRTGLLFLPALTLMAGAGLMVHRRHSGSAPRQNTDNWAEQPDVAHAAGRPTRYGTEHETGPAPRAGDGTGPCSDETPA